MRLEDVEIWQYAKLNCTSYIALKIRSIIRRYRGNSLPVHDIKTYSHYSPRYQMELSGQPDALAA